MRADNDLEAKSGVLAIGKMKPISTLRAKVHLKPD